MKNLIKSGLFGILFAIFIELQTYFPTEWTKSLIIMGAVWLVNEVTKGKNKK